MTADAPRAARATTHGLQTAQAPTHAPQIPIEQQQQPQPKPQPKPHKPHKPYKIYQPYPPQLATLNITIPDK